MVLFSIIMLTLLLGSGWMLKEGIRNVMHLKQKQPTDRPRLESFEAWRYVVTGALSTIGILLVYGALLFYYFM